MDKNLMPIPFVNVGHVKETVSPDEDTENVMMGKKKNIPHRAITFFCNSDAEVENAKSKVAKGFEHYITPYKPGTKVHTNAGKGVAT